MVLGLLWVRENCGRRNGVLGRDEEVRTGGFEVEDEAGVSGLLSGREKSRRRGRRERKHTGGEGRFKGSVQVNWLVEPAGLVQLDRSGFFYLFFSSFFGRFFSWNLARFFNLRHFLYFSHFFCHLSPFSAFIQNLQNKIISY